MLIFHEGLPGSGKSYESVVKHILPAIESGRRVYARVDGFDTDDCLVKIADLLDLTLDDVKQRLIHVSKQDVFNLSSIVTENSFVVIDEIARYWSTKGKRAFVNDEIVDFLKEHRHFGIDILAMDQDLRDVSPLWRRRVDRKVVFTKLDMLGAKANYKWKMYKAMEGEKFELIGKGVGKYERKYFGTYSSHVNDLVSAENYKDNRSVLFHRPVFKYGMPLLLILIVFCAFFIASLFDPERSVLLSSKQREMNRSSSVKDEGAKSLSSSAVAPAVYYPPVREVVKEQKQESSSDYFVSLVTGGCRVRLVSVLSSPNRDPYVVVEVRDESLRVKDRLDDAMLFALGWRVYIINLKMVRIFKDGQPEFIATSWPIEYDKRLSVATNDEIRRAGTHSERRLPEPKDRRDVDDVSVPAHHVDAGLPTGFDPRSSSMDPPRWVKSPVYGSR